MNKGRVSAFPSELKRKRVFRLATPSIPLGKVAYVSKKAASPNGIGKDKSFTSFDPSHALHRNDTKGTSLKSMC